MSRGQVSKTKSKPSGLNRDYAERGREEKSEGVNLKHILGGYAQEGRASVDERGGISPVSKKISKGKASTAEKAGRKKKENVRASLKLHEDDGLSPDCVRS